MPKEYREIVTEVESRQGSFGEVESATFGFDHAQVGSLLLQKWSFPQELIDAVERHHRPVEVTEENRNLSLIINIGNFMAKKLDVGFDDYAVENLAELDSVSALNLDPGKLEEIQSRIKEHFEEEKELFILSK